MIERAVGIEQLLQIHEQSGLSALVVDGASAMMEVIAPALYRSVLVKSAMVSMKFDYS